MHYVIKTSEKGWFELTRVRIPKRFSVSCSKCKGQHYKRKIFCVKNCVFNQKSQISEIFQKCFLDTKYQHFDYQNSFAVE